MMSSESSSGLFPKRISSKVHIEGISVPVALETMALYGAHG